MAEDEKFRFDNASGIPSCFIEPMEIVKCQLRDQFGLRHLKPLCGWKKSLNGLHHRGQPHVSLLGGRRETPPVFWTVPSFAAGQEEMQSGGGDAAFDGSCLSKS